MKAVVWHGEEDVRVDRVPDPSIQEPTDAIVRITSTAICGSDLHLYGPLAAVMEEGDILGHEPMGVVEEVGSETGDLAVGDRVVIPFNISCGHCWMCDHGLQSQCETTQNPDQGTGASLFGYTKLYGHVPGGQAEYLRVPQAQYGPIKVADGPSDQRYLYLSDVLPTAWQGVKYADVGPDGTIVVYGLGPIGQMAVRVARHLGIGSIVAVDPVAERRKMAADWGAEVVDPSSDDVVEAVYARTDGRGADGVVDAVGLEGTHGASDQAMEGESDQVDALGQALRSVRRGGTLSLSGVYADDVHGFPLGMLFDRQITVRQGQANVKHWAEEILPLLDDDADPLGTEQLATHTLPLDEAVRGYDIFQRKVDDAIKVVLQP